MPQLTWQDIVEFVSEVHRKEGAVPNRSFYRHLAHQALALMALESRLLTKKWSNTDEGGLTIHGNIVQLPPDCIYVESVEWNSSDNILTRKTTAQLNLESPGWRENTGDPTAYAVLGSQIILDSVPQNPANGSLVVRGVSLFPDFSDEPDAKNPLSYIPASHQLLPAYYILANLPLDPQKPEELARQQFYAQRW